LEAIALADCLIYDRLGAPTFLKHAKATCKQINVGKIVGKEGKQQTQINKLLVKQAQISKTVVRLKGGDPALFV